MEQRTPEWYAARCGRFTASRLGDLLARTKSGPAASRQNYIAELICQRLTGHVEPLFTTAAMQRGIDLEAQARSIYMLETGEMVEETGLVLHPELDCFGASPDGLVGSAGLIEIKCPNTWTHLETLRTGEPSRGYVLQMQGQMACTGRAWCDFVSYDDRLPPDLAFFSVRVERDDALIGEVLAEIRAADAEINTIIQQLNNRRYAA